MLLHLSLWSVKHFSNIIIILHFASINVIIVIMLPIYLGTFSSVAFCKTLDFILLYYYYYMFTFLIFICMYPISLSLLLLLLLLYYCIIIIIRVPTLCCVCNWPCGF
jgi:hypothetical protein